MIRLNGNDYMICMRGEVSSVCRCVNGKWTPLDHQACALMVIVSRAR